MCKIIINNATNLFFRLQSAFGKYKPYQFPVGSVACWTQSQKGPVQIAVAMLSGNSLRQTVHTHCASVHKAAKLVAALLRVAGDDCRPGGK